MKILLFLITAAAVCLLASAAQYNKVTVLDGSNGTVITTNASGIFTNYSGTNNSMLVAAVASTNGVQGTNIMRPVLVNSTTVGFFTSFKLAGTGTAGPTFTLQKSYNGTN